MRTQLLDQGLADAVFEPERRPPRSKASEMTRLVRTLATLEEAHHRPGAPRHQPQDPRRAPRPDTAGSRSTTSSSDGREEWFTTRGELDNFVAAQEEEAGGKLNVDVGMHSRQQPAPPAAAPTATRRQRTDGRIPIAPRLRIVELHEVRTINTALADLDQIRLRRSKPSSRKSAPATEEPPLHAPPRRKRNRPRRPPRPARRHPRRRRKGPADHPLQRPRRNERRRAPRHHARPRQPHARSKSAWTTPAAPTTSSASSWATRSNPAANSSRKHALEVRNLDV